MPIQTAHTLPPMTAWIVQYHNSGQSGQSAPTPQEIINDNDHTNENEHATKYTSSLPVTGIWILL